MFVCMYLGPVYPYLFACTVCILAQFWPIPAYVLTYIMCLCICVCVFVYDGNIVHFVLIWASVYLHKRCVCVGVQICVCVHVCAFEPRHGQFGPHRQLLSATRPLIIAIKGGWSALPLMCSLKVIPLFVGGAPLTPYPTPAGRPLARGPSPLYMGQSKDPSPAITRTRVCYITQTQWHILQSV